MVSADALRTFLPLLLVTGLVATVPLALVGAWRFSRNRIRQQRAVAHAAVGASQVNDCRLSAAACATAPLRDPLPIQESELRSGGRTFTTSLPSCVTDGSQTLTRDEAVEALRRAEAKYRSIFENAIEGIFQTTPEGQYLSANPALARIYDYDSPAQLMASIGDIERQLYVDPHRRDEFVRIMEEQGFVANFESQIYRRDGSVIWIAESARAVRGARRQHRVLRGDRRGHYRAQAIRSAVPRKRGRRSGQSRQEPVPGQHEPRAAHAAQRRDRHARFAAGVIGVAAAEALSPRSPAARPTCC